MSYRLRQVELKNYKNLAAISVTLEPLTILVGPNGAGKSNFVDALRFVKECLTQSITVALQNRGGIGVVRRHSRGHPTHFGFRFQMESPQLSADYAFEIAAKPRGAFEVKRERCLVEPVMGEPHGYDVVGGRFKREIPGIRPKLEPDRLALVAVSGVEEFRPVYDFLTCMQFYAIASERIRRLQEPNPGEVLNHDGSNAAAVLREIEQRDNEAYERLCRLLSKVVPGTSRVEYVSIGQRETIRFKQDVGDTTPWAFDALSMSDGTLRVLGILLAVYQVSPPSLIAIEEPEATIHPAALEVLVDILMDGAHRAQILLTTHSPDILDDKDILDHRIRVVESHQGKATIGPLGKFSRQAIKQRLYTVGELLRMGEIATDRDPEEQSVQQLNLFKVTTPHR